MIFLRGKCQLRLSCWHCVGAAPSAKPCEVCVVAFCAHTSPCLLVEFRPCGANVISEHFSSVFFSRFRELELCDFLYFVAPHNQYSAQFSSRQYHSENISWRAKKSPVKMTNRLNSEIPYFSILEVKNSSVEFSRSSHKSLCALRLVF